MTSFFQIPGGGASAQLAPPPAGAHGAKLVKLDIDETVLRKQYYDVITFKFQGGVSCPRFPIPTIRKPMLYVALPNIRVACAGACLQPLLPPPSFRLGLGRSPS